MAAETMVRTYNKTGDYQKDATKLAQQGWTVANVAMQQPHSGCGRIVLIGVLAAIFKPKPVIIVTYQRERPA
jgi:hypothetical protein